MRRVAKFKTVARVTGGAASPVTVTINRNIEPHLFTVRPYKRHKSHELPLSTVAEIVVWHCVKADLKAKKAAKKAAKKGR